MTRFIKRLSMAVVAALFAFAFQAQAHGPAAGVPLGTPTAAPAAAPTGAPAGAPAGVPGGSTGSGIGGATGGAGAGGATGGAGGGFGGAPIGGGIKKAAGGAGRVDTRLAGTSHTPNVARLLDMHFVDAEWPMGAAEGYAKQPQPLWNLIHDKCFDAFCTDLHCKHFQCHDKSCMRDKKAAMVYVYDPNETREKKLEREKMMFGSDDIAAMSNFVHSFSMAAEEVELAEYNKNFGTKLPALIFLSPTGTTVGVLQGDISKTEITSMFEKTFESCYGIALSKRIVEYKEVLKRIEKAEDEAAVAGARLRELELKARDTGASAKLDDAKAKLETANKAYQQAESDRRSLLSLKIVTAPEKETAMK